MAWFDHCRDWNSQPESRGETHNQSLAIDADTCTNTEILHLHLRRRHRTKHILLPNAESYLQTSFSLKKGGNLPQRQERHYLLSVVAASNTLQLIHVRQDGDMVP